MDQLQHVLGAQENLVADPELRGMIRLTVSGDCDPLDRVLGFIDFRIGDPRGDGSCVYLPRGTMVQEAFVTPAAAQSSSSVVADGVAAIADQAEGGRKVVSGGGPLAPHSHRVVPTQMIPTSWYVVKNIRGPSNANIYPREVEDVLTRHPEVSEAIVFGVPDPEWGENVASAIVLREGCRRRCGYTDRVLPGLSWERQEAKADRIVTELPKNAYGKVLRRDLRDRFNCRRSKDKSSSRQFKK